MSLNFFSVNRPLPIKLFSLSASTFAVAAILIGACTPKSPESRLEQLRTSKLEKGAEILAECRETKCSDLRLSFASLEDYAVLNEMTHVTALELRYNTFESLEDISSMRQLEELRITATKIRDVSAFANFENLKVLHIQSGLAEDVRPTLLQMPDLEQIAINLPDDGDISFVGGLPDLKKIRLLGSQVSDLRPLVGHPSLSFIFIHSGLPRDLSALLEVPNLQTLWIFDTIEQNDSSGVIEQLKANGITVNLIPTVIL
ncbi:hypothetical protein [Ruegeria sp. EL01]|uniref:hypothetical protein n=1 Tax=Ruegeria sp. EL01 TaxID=2107578 RepID=UPI000EA81991|nr:hypothetical protein [Ruegeria sp. EL01]